MGISEFLNESLLGKSYDKPIYIIPRGLKIWLTTINKVIKKVPKEAIPNVICAFSASNTLLSRKIITPSLSKSKNAFVIQSDSLEVPKELVSSDTIGKAQDFSMYKNDNDGWNHLMEIKKTVKVYSKYHDIGIFNVFSINTKKYKTPKEMSESKAKINEHYKKTNPKGWWVNLDAEATICHEFGHIYDKAKGIRNKGEWVSLAQRWIVEDNAPEYCDPKNSVGDFSGKHYGEAFAEAFANTIIHNGKDIPDYIYKYVKSVI